MCLENGILSNLPCPLTLRMGTYCFAQLFQNHYLVGRSNQAMSVLKMYNLQVRRRRAFWDTHLTACGYPQFPWISIPCELIWSLFYRQVAQLFTIRCEFRLVPSPSSEI